MSSEGIKEDASNVASCFHRRVLINSLQTVLLTSAALVATDLLYHAFLVALHDSQDNIWGAARALLQGHDPYAQYLQCNPCRKPPFLPPVSPMYPASALVMMWPMAMLDWTAAKIVWALLGIALGVGLVLMLDRLFLPAGGWQRKIWASLAFVASTPFLNNLGNGQHAVFALAFFAAAVLIERNGHCFPASVFLALSWFKYSLTLPLSLLFLLRGRLAILLEAVAVHILLTLIASARTGTDPVTLLVEPMRVFASVGSVGHLEVYGLATRLGITSKLVPILAATAITLLVLWAAYRGREAGDGELLSLLSLFAYAATYHYPYDLVILVIPFCHLLGRLPQWGSLAKRERAWLVCLAVSIAWIWYVDHPIQLLKTLQIPALLAIYPFYYMAQAACFYSSFVTGIVCVAQERTAAPDLRPGKDALPSSAPNPTRSLHWRSRRDDRRPSGDAGLYTTGRL